MAVAGLLVYRFAFAAVVLVSLPSSWPPVASAQTWNCDHCHVGEGFDEFLKPEEPSSADEPHSDVHVLWPTHIEVIPLAVENGGWEPPAFHERISREAIRGWKAFRSKIVPTLSKSHPLRRQLQQKHAGALNDAFFHWQKRLFEESGDVKKSLDEDDAPGVTPSPDANTTWPEFNGLPEYQRLRQIVDRLSRRYLIRSGMARENALALNYSIFNWAAVHGPGEFHGPHTHVGEYHVGVFYAQAGPSAGKLRLGDPRGHSPPFGRSFFHTPRSGDLIFFPSWLSHMATVTSPSSDMIHANGTQEPKRVVISFNIGPVAGPLPCHLWWSDPTGDMRFRRRSTINPAELGF